MPTAAKARLRLAALLVCLAGIVIGARWTVLDRYGSDLPSWDQWDAEGLNLLAPWAEHRLTPEMLLAPHNEHRVVLTKLASLALAAADGQWDQRLECAFNALIAAAISAGLFALGLRAWGRRRQGILFVLLASAYALPLAWQNILYGFHSQQLFLVASRLRRSPSCRTPGPGACAGGSAPGRRSGRWAASQPVCSRRRSPGESWPPGGSAGAARCGLSFRGFACARGSSPRAFSPA